MRGRGGDGIQIFHFLFVNNTHVLCEIVEDWMTYMSSLLMWFEAIDGL